VKRSHHAILPRSARVAGVVGGGWAWRVVAVVATLLGGIGCTREERGFRVATPSVGRGDAVRLTAFQPGPASPTPIARNDYEANAHAMAEGQRLFSAFNCTGCHGNGGGSIGPALMDDKWRYGSEPQQVFASIMQGRPNGMPSFRGKLPEHQAWQIAAYVRSLSGLVPKDAATSRSDHMKSNPPSNSVDPVKSVKGEPAPNAP
jgi:cytochrome c oxidase cbb3-type subunit III